MVKILYNIEPSGGSDVAVYVVLNNQLAGGYGRYTQHYYRSLGGTLQNLVSFGANPAYGVTLGMAGAGATYRGWGTLEIFGSNLTTGLRVRGCNNTKRYYASGNNLYEMREQIDSAVDNVGPLTSFRLAPDYITPNTANSIPFNGEYQWMYTL